MNSKDDGLNLALNLIVPILIIGGAGYLIVRYYVNRTKENLTPYSIYLQN